MHLIHHLRRGVVLLLLAALLGPAGCSKDTTTAPTNQPPVITGITAAKTTVTMGERVSVTATVTDADGDSLAYLWSATHGTLSSTTGSTVNWTAPEEHDIVATIHLKVDDGVNVVTGSLDIGVGVYVPAVQPYYVGAVACQSCHSTAHTAWAASEHAGAMLSFGPTHCRSCHTTGYDTSVANGGYDELPIARLEGVQCESCHGPGSAHVASFAAADIALSISETQCQSCHEQGHDNLWQNWAASGHGSGGSITGYPGGANAACSTCHSGNGFIAYAKGQTVTTYAAEDLITVNCVTCHEPHSADNPHQVRKMDAVTLPGGVVADTGGMGLLCANCHTGRSSQSAIASQVASGHIRFGPHHGNQASILWPDVFAPQVAPEGFHWSSTQHARIENSCVTCHMHGETDGPTGHAWQASLESCTPCHGTLDDFNIRAKADYDGNGQVEGIQTEVKGLLNLVAGAIVSAGLDTTALGLRGAVGSGDDHEAWTGVAIEKSLIRAAGFNYLTVQNDHSYGIHNPAFTVQLLQQSYRAVAGIDVPGARMLASGDH